MSDKKVQEADALNGVRSFHKLFNMPVLEAPKIPDSNRCNLRVALLQEELDELKTAILENDLVEVADALADLQYVLSGAILEFGLGDIFSQIFDEVQRSNMSKACTSLSEAEETVAYYESEKNTEAFIEKSGEYYLVYRKADRKVLKSINYSPAELNHLVLSNRTE